MHLALSSVIGSLLGSGLISALAWDWWRHPLEPQRVHERHDPSRR